jgi:hypothetical protein
MLKQETAADHEQDARQARFFEKRAQEKGRRYRGATADEWRAQAEKHERRAAELHAQSGSRK